MRHFLEKLLGRIARMVVKKYRPKIVAITGSVGKTTTRAACVAVLSVKYRVRGSEKNYNNEIGVPITILGCDPPGRSPIAWVGIFLKGMWLLFSNDPLYPQVLVLEMGADHPGDLGYLLSIAQPDVGVVTAVSPAHTEFFNSVAGVLAEKKTVVTLLESDKVAVINGDDEQLRKIVHEVSAKIILYGCGNGLDVEGCEIKITYDEEGKLNGMQSEVVVDGQELMIRVLGVLGRPVVYALLGAIAVGRAMDLDASQIETGLASFQAPAGRLRIIDGIKRTILIDDTYNASPRAATEALKILSEIKSSGRRIAVLGDMLELGSFTEVSHREIGALVAELHIDILITVGAVGIFLAEEARVKGMADESVFSFDASSEAGKFLQERMHEGDIVLIKGSQGIRCEKIVKEVMAEPLLAEKLLVRQDAKWL